MLLFSDVRLMMLNHCQLVLNPSVSLGLVPRQLHAALKCSIRIVILRIHCASASVHLALQAPLFLFYILHTVSQFQQVNLAIGRVRQRSRANVDADDTMPDGMLRRSTCRVALDCGLAL